MKMENILLLIAITMFVCAYVSFLIFLIGEINYIREHPCIETRTEERCFTHKKCVGGIMAPGFCLTEDEVICRQETYCVKRK